MRACLAAVVIVMACDPAPDPASATPKTPAVAPPAVAPAPPPSPVNPAQKPAMHPITLDWKLEHKGSALFLSYSIQNTSNKQVVLLDRLYSPTSKGNEPAFDRAIVQDTDIPGVVAFVRGYVKPSQPIGGVHPPLSRKLEPKQTITGEATIPLPLVAWHNFARAVPLRDTPKHAVLEIGYLVDHGKWVKIKLSDGSEPSAPGHPFVNEQQLIRGDSKPIP